MQREAKNPIKHRVITLLSREEMEFLDKLGKDAMFSSGHKLTYSEILKALTDFAMEIKLSGDKVDSADSLERKIFEQIWKKVGEQIKVIQRNAAGNIEKKPLSKRAEIALKALDRLGILIW